MIPVCVWKVLMDFVTLNKQKSDKIAWQKIGEPLGLAVTSAVCISVFVCVIVLGKVVNCGGAILLFCWWWCFSLQFRDRPFQWHWYLVWPDRRQLNHLIFCTNRVRFSSIVFTFGHLLWWCLPLQYMHGFSSNLHSYWSFLVVGVLGSWVFRQLGVYE